MHFWLVRVLLNIAALAAGGAVGAAGMMATGSPISFVFAVLIYFFLAWGLAVQATQGPVRVGLGAYTRPLLLTFWPLGAVAMVILLAGQAAMEANPETPDFAAGMEAIFTPLNFVIVVAGGLVISVLLLIPAVVAIVDQPPPDDQPAGDQAVDAAGPGSTMTVAAAPIVQSLPPTPEPRGAEINPDPAREDTLEELFGLEPGHRA